MRFTLEQKHHQNNFLGRHLAKLQIHQYLLWNVPWSQNTLEETLVDRQLANLLSLVYNLTDALQDEILHAGDFRCPFCHPVSDREPTIRVCLLNDRCHHSSMK